MTTATVPAARATGKRAAVKPVEQRRVRVGNISRRSEARLRAQLRGNDGDGVRLPLVDEEGRERRYLAGEALVDLHFYHVEDRGEDGKRIIVRYCDRKTRLSPLNPNGLATGMRRCPECGRLTPPVAFEEGRCLDCGDERAHAIWGESPSAQAIASLAMRHERIYEKKLPSVRTAHLKRECRRFRAGHWKPRQR